MKVGKFGPLFLRNELINTNRHGILLRKNAIMIKFLKSTENKCAFIVRKKFGNAPQRNKFKRQIREILRKTNLFDEKKIYCLIIAKNQALHYHFNELKNEMETMLTSIQHQI